MALLNWKSKYSKLVGSEEAPSHKWRAKRPTKYQDSDPRIEVRKHFSRRVTYSGEKHKHHSANMLMVVRKDGSVRISFNAQAMLSASDWQELIEAVEEAKEVLQE